MPLVIKTKKKQFFAEYNGSCLMGFGLFVFYSLLFCFLCMILEISVILIVKPLKYSEIKLIFDLDQNTFT